MATTTILTEAGDKRGDERVDNEMIPQLYSDIPNIITRSRSHGWKRLLNQPEQ